MRANRGISGPARPKGYPAPSQRSWWKRIDGAGVRAEILVAQEVETVLRVAPHQLALGLVERTGLLHDRRRQRELADVHEEEPQSELQQRVVRQREAASGEQPDHGRVDRAVSLSGQVIRRLGQALDLGHDAPRRAGELVEALVRQQVARHAACIGGGALEGGHGRPAREVRQRPHALRERSHPFVIGSRRRDFNALHPRS